MAKLPDLVRKRAGSDTRGENFSGVSDSTLDIGIVAGEAIPALSAICIGIDSGVYKVFLCDTSANLSASFIGISTAAAAVGEAVSYRSVGFVSGFSGLTPFTNQFLSSTPGQLSEVASGATIKIGTSVSATAIAVNAFENGFIMPLDLLMVSSHGSNAGLNVTGAQSTTDHFDFTSWSSATADSNTLTGSGQGESALGGFHYWVDGIDTGTTYTTINRAYNKTSWSAAAVRVDDFSASATATLDGDLTRIGGFDGSSNTNKIGQFDGTSWTDTLTGTGTERSQGCFFHAGTNKIHTTGNESAATVNRIFDGVSMVAGAVVPQGSGWFGGFQTTGGNGMCHSAGSGNTNTYDWSGSSWSTAITMSYTATSDTAVTLNQQSVCGFNANTGKSYSNGGNQPTGVSITSTGTFDGAAWAGDVAATNGRSGASGAIF